VVVTGDLPYASVHGSAWIPPLLDVYAPAGAHGLPLVVLFHGVGPGIDKASLQYPDLARAIAREGAVVISANWGQQGMPWDRSIRQVVHDEGQMRDEGACAVSYAVRHAAEYGADPTRLVLFGHSGGANQAGRVGLTQTSPFPGCAVPPVRWTVSGLLLWDGDFLLANPGFDVFGTGLPRLLEVMTPWPSLATAPRVGSVAFVVSTSSRDALSTPDASKTAGWLNWRDPTGRMQRVLDRLGAFADGWLDVGEEAKAMISGLRARGIEARYLELTDPSTTHEFLSEADFGRMVQEVLSLTRD
jgi:acetyl esterase/lipase